MTIKQFLIYTILGIGIYTSLCSCTKKQDDVVPIVQRNVKYSMDVYYSKSPYQIDGFLVNKSLYTAILYSSDLSLNNYSTQRKNNTTYLAKYDVNTNLNISYRVDYTKNTVDSVVTYIYVDNNLVFKSNQLTFNYTVK